LLEEILILVLLPHMFHQRSLYGHQYHQLRPNPQFLSVVIGVGCQADPVKTSLPMLEVPFAPAQFKGQARSFRKGGVVTKISCLYPSLAASARFIYWLMAAELFLISPGVRARVSRR